MLKNIVALFAVMQAANAASYYRSRNDVTGSGLTYSGFAWGMNDSWEYEMIPVSQCPGECAINGTCASKDECAA